jgi:hypothetical protein
VVDVAATTVATPRTAQPTAPARATPLATTAVRKVILAASALLLRQRRPATAAVALATSAASAHKMRAVPRGMVPAKCATSVASGATLLATAPRELAASAEATVEVMAAVVAMVDLVRPPATHAVASGT